MLAPSQSLVDAFRSFGERQRRPAGVSNVDIGGVLFPQFDFDKRRFVLVRAAAGSTLRSIADRARATAPPSFRDPHLFEINICAQGVPARGQEQVVDRGIRVLALHDGLAALLALPRGLPRAQDALLKQTLSALPRSADGYQIAPLSIVPDAGTPQDGVAWLDNVLTWNGPLKKLLYLRAEAGKGKSTLLAHWVRSRFDTGDGPLPVFVPLRDLQRGSGISWEAIAASIGILDTAAADLAEAVRTGLVSLVLDGLDEVSGRYDRRVVQQVLNLALTNLASDTAIVAISGRTTEGTLLSAEHALQAGIELPETTASAFRTYAEAVADAIAPEWPHVAARLPEPPIAGAPLADRPMSVAERTALLDWVLLSFDEVGKERSLFFVQSLVCIGRTYQLAGNRPLVIRSPAGTQLAECSLFDACILAASLACVREQDKIEDIARGFFAPDKQLTLLTWLALSASGEAALVARLPSAPERAQAVFHIDTVHQNEQFTAILRQVQKHALLYAARDISVGDWRPLFLSDWVRGALLARAWLQRFVVATGEERFALFSIIARAERSRVAFQHIFPDVAGRFPESDPGDLARELIKEGSAGSPEACGNFWAFVSGLTAQHRDALPGRPSALAEGTDLSELEFEGVDFGPEFSGALGLFVSAEFTNCTLTECSFESSDFSQAEFRNCRLMRVSFTDCDGPTTFEGCDFVDCTFTNARSRTLPPWSFHECRFFGRSLISQATPARGGAVGAVAAFFDCVAEPEELVTGEWAGIVPGRLPGVTVAAAAAASDPAEETLARLLRPFFPSHVGSNEDPQARGYIRSSAIGRGVLPAGAPSATALTNILLAEGFTRGGRTGHIYAPWSSVTGATNRGLRSELVAFLRNRQRGPTVERFLERIRREATW